MRINRISLFISTSIVLSTLLMGSDFGKRADVQRG